MLRDPHRYWPSNLLIRSPRLTRLFVVACSLTIIVRSDQLKLTVCPWSRTWTGQALPWGSVSSTLPVRGLRML